MTARLTWMARSTALIGLGLGLGLAATELCLQLTAGARAALGRRPPSMIASTRATVLCVGDSNTYGLYLDESESYPAQLQRLLGDRVRVVNVSFPGLNSSRLLAQFPTILDAVRPQTVLMLIGVNDGWTAPVGTDEGEPWSTVLSRWSRTYRLLYMLWRSASGTAAVDRPRITAKRGESTVSGEDGTAWIGDRAVQLGWTLEQQHHWLRRYEDNLSQMVAMARQRGATPILLTYPSDSAFYREASAVVWRAAEPLGVSVLDLHAQLQARCTMRDCGSLFFPDGHPTAAGYAQIAAIVAAWLADNGSPARPPL